MAGFHGYQTSVWHETEDAILWSPTDENFEYSPLDISMMTRLAMSTEYTTDSSNFQWENATTSSSAAAAAAAAAAAMMTPSICNADPMDRLAEGMSGSKEQGLTSGPSFGLHNQPSQWHVQEQDIDWQSLNQCCNNNAYLQMQDPTMPDTPLFSCQPFVSNHHQRSQTHSQNHSHSHGHSHNRNHSATPRTSNSEHLAATTPIVEPLPDVFASTRAPYQDPPPPASSIPADAHPQRKSKRCSDDLYTPRWVRNAGTLREGWCGWCASWFTLRDSAYWYHMHYSHGISQANSGRRLPAPAAYRASSLSQPVEWEVKCGKCARWMPLLPGDKCNTAYFRHTYKCYFKTMSGAARGDKSGPSSPVKTSSSAAATVAGASASASASPSRRRMDML